MDKQRAMDDERLKDVFGSIRWVPWKTRDRALLFAILVIGAANLVFVLFTLLSV